MSMSTTFQTPDNLNKNQLRNTQQLFTQERVQDPKQVLNLQSDP